LKGAKDDGQGHLIGGHYTLTANTGIEDFSLVQYTGTEPNPSQSPKNAHFVYDGEEMGLYAYVRSVMSGGTSGYNPIHEMKITLRALCSDVKDRANTVNLAMSENIQAEPHPARLPQNIYDSSDGDWEKYATPARDARLRENFAQFYRHMDRLTEMWVFRDPRIIYDGEDLKGDLLALYEAQAGTCDLTYLNSAKRPVLLTLADIPARLYAMSYDPYDCIELRWGASGAERDTCPQSEKKLRWYAAQQRLRSSTKRSTNYAYDLDELEALGGKDMEAPPPVDIRAMLAAMPDRIALAPMMPVGR
jgi:hypothetical protein